MVCKGKQLLPQAVPVLLGPLVRQEFDDVVPALQEGTAVAPDGVRRVGLADSLRIPIQSSAFPVPLPLICNCYVWLTWCSRHLEQP